ncbi:lipase family protein [Catenulispora rubra]|uniref:lipase family protein n=1 Tax=Catenulispora rubra TaxID=280293 RepID=UPI0018927DAF|nr:lipase family protein [Catenulispora rubra]
MPATAKAGDILWVQQRSDAPTGASGWNVIYVSQIQPGVMSYVSGEVFVPNAQNSQARNVVLWNHPTAGMTDDCAPSRETLGDENGNNAVPAVQDLINAGDLVVASDYPGLGLYGPAYYMTGDPNARASLDLIRAVRSVPALSASANFVQYGWSQGGQTSEHLDALAKSYAPELHPVATALIAPATRIKALTQISMPLPGPDGYMLMTLRGIQAAYPQLKFSDFLTPAAMEEMPLIADGCYDPWGATAMANWHQPGAMAPGSPWSNAMTAIDNFQPGGTMPYTIFQGSDDTTVPPSLTQAERTVLCKAGSPVQYNEMAGKDHTTIVPVAAAALPQWIADRFAGKPAPSNCPA